MPLVQEIAEYLEREAPLYLAEEWDNVGLLLGDPLGPVQRALTCLTLTEDVAEEAVRCQTQLVVTHHPILFRKVRRLTTQTAEGRTLLRLAAGGIAVYSPHTSYDSAADGINQQLAAGLELSNTRPIRPLPEDPGSGSGRIGELAQPCSLEELLTQIRVAFRLPRLQFTRGDGRKILRVGLACGSAAEFLGDTDQLGGDVLVTGEARFHALLEARARGVGLVLLGHFASERPAVERLAERLSREFPGLAVHASEVESDPLEWA